MMGGCACHRKLQKERKGVQIWWWHSISSANCWTCQFLCIISSVMILDDGFQVWIFLEFCCWFVTSLYAREGCANAARCSVLHAVLSRQSPDQRRPEVWEADGGAGLQHKSHHASIPGILEQSQTWKICPIKAHRHCRLSRSDFYYWEQ